MLTLPVCPSAPPPSPTLSLSNPSTDPSSFHLSRGYPGRFLSSCWAPLGTAEMATFNGALKRPLAISLCLPPPSRNSEVKIPSFPSDKYRQVRDNSTRQKRQLQLRPQPAGPRSSIGFFLQLSGRVSKREREREEVGENFFLLLFSYPKVWQH